MNELKRIYELKEDVCNFIPFCILGFLLSANIPICRYIVPDQTSDLYNASVRAI